MYFDNTFFVFREPELRSPVKRCKAEGVQIARILSENGESIVGVVHLWNTKELSLMWTGNKREAGFIDPPLEPEIIEQARAANADSVFKQIELLSRNRPPTEY